MFKSWLPILSCMALLAGSGSIANAAPDQQLYLWCWERPDHITDETVGIAFLAKTITICGDKLSIRPRLQPLSAPPRSNKMAVVRIEVDGKQGLPVSEQSRIAQRGKIISEILRSLRGISELQIDFDARLNERPYYKELIAELRKVLPRNVRLSMTALVSWCLFDNWLEGMDVDEIVPMAFSMGAETNNILEHFKAGKGLLPSCSKCLGLAVDEESINEVVIARFSKDKFRRIYLFNPRAWRTGDIDAGKRLANQLVSP